MNDLRPSKTTSNKTKKRAVSHKIKGARKYQLKHHVASVSRFDKRENPFYKKSTSLNNNVGYTFSKSTRDFLIGS